MTRPTKTDSDHPFGAFGRLEDAQAEAKMAAAILATHFEAVGRDAGDDEEEMFAAMGLADLARAIRTHIDAMFVAAKELRDQAELGSQARAGGVAAAEGA